MKAGAAGSFGAQLKTLREAAGFTQEELATGDGPSTTASPAPGRVSQSASATVIHLAAGQQIVNADIHLLPGRPTRRLEVVLNWNGIHVADTYGAFVTATTADIARPDHRRRDRPDRGSDIWVLDAERGVKALNQHS